MLGVVPRLWMDMAPLPSLHRRLPNPAVGQVLPAALVARTDSRFRKLVTGIFICRRGETFHKFALLAGPTALREGLAKGASYPRLVGIVARKDKSMHGKFCNQAQNYQCKPVASMTINL